MYWTSSRAEELAEYDKIVLQTSKMVALGAVIKLYYVNTWISLHAWLLARLEMKFNLKLKLSHTWAAMLRLELDHLAQKIISKENPRGEGAFAVPCLSPLFWHYTMECWQINHISQNDTGTGIQIVYNSAQYSERKNLENGGYTAAFKWLSFSHTHTRMVNKNQFHVLLMCRANFHFSWTLYLIDFTLKYAETCIFMDKCNNFWWT